MFFLWLLVNIYLINGDKQRGVYTQKKKEEGGVIPTVFQDFFIIFILAIWWGRWAKNGYEPVFRWSGVFYFVVLWTSLVLYLMLAHYDWMTWYVLPANSPTQKFFFFAMTILVEGLLAVAGYLLGRILNNFGYLMFMGVPLILLGWSTIVFFDVIFPKAGLPLSIIISVGIFIIVSLIYIIPIVMWFRSPRFSSYRKRLIKAILSAFGGDETLENPNHYRDYQLEKVMQLFRSVDPDFQYLLHPMLTWLNVLSLLKVRKRFLKCTNSQHLQLLSQMETSKFFFTQITYLMFKSMHTSFFSDPKIKKWMGYERLFGSSQYSL